jgi:hypothetical protein
MATNTVKFTWNNRAFETIEKKTLEGIFAMSYDIANQARRNAPVITSALRNSIRVEEDGFTTYIKAGGVVAQSTIGAKYVDYAMKREQGPNRNPATEHYMRNAMNATMSGDYMQKYFGGITK